MDSLAILACVFLTTRYSVKTVPTGYVSVEVQLYGSDKDVQQTFLGNHSAPPFIQLKQKK